MCSFPQLSVLVVKTSGNDRYQHAGSSLRHCGSSAWLSSGSLTLQKSITSGSRRNMGFSCLDVVRSRKIERENGRLTLTVA